MHWKECMLITLPVSTVRPLGGAKESTTASQARFLFCGIHRPYILTLYYIHVHLCNQQQLTVYKASSPPRGSKGLISTSQLPSKKASPVYEALLQLLLVE